MTEENKDCFYTEHYPLTKRYYAVHKFYTIIHGFEPGDFLTRTHIYYLVKNNNTGLIELTSLDEADWFLTEEGAINHIKLYKEQRLKKNVIVKVID